MCCGGRMCMLCTCVILVAILIGLLFGFGVFKNGFHKLKDAIHPDFNARPFLGFNVAPAPF
ncbi:hypothetical protein P3X46_016945 [Hevea brasiliensis]|uniref:Uncharacterized protein n=1 Tax=Hevea brasiliensis TaxID=3981 RepID=A0ABQ9M0Q0_HEVBR|nr:hypothetical protein P3X46_016945 [Hevea brasiliensis]